MLLHFNYPPHEAGVRARTIYLTQIGYPCERSDLERFVSRHAPNLEDWLQAYDLRRAVECLEENT